MNVLKNVKKVAVIGAGLVGSSAAYSLINQGICDELVMIDINNERAKGETWDLLHCIDFLPSRTKISDGSYLDCKDADIVIITAGPPPKKGQTRLDTLEISAKIMKSIVSEVMASGFDGIFLIASNPVDIMTYMVWKLSGFPRNRVIGTGTSLDSSRLKNYLSEILDVDPRSINGYTMGEHGDSQFAAWSHMTIGGKPLLHILKEHEKEFGNVDLELILEKVKRVGFEILERKGTTYYGIGSALAYITKEIFNDSHKIVALSTILDGEYGYKDICTGVPAILTREGIKEVVELNLTETETKRFEKSNATLREYMKMVGYGQQGE